MPEVVDFQALMPEPWEIKTREGVSFKADPDMSGEEAMYFLRNAGALGGQDSAERCIKVVLKAFQRCQPDMTEKQLLTHFRLSEVINLAIRFLAQVGPLALPSTPAAGSNRKQRRLAKKR